MPFDLDKDFSVFDKLFEKRPELSPEGLKKDLASYYLPYLEKLIELKKRKQTSEGLIVGISAIQGAGKTTQGEILEILLKHMGFSSVSRSIDDHYTTHKELCELRERDPRVIRRGVTHDIALAILNLRDLRQMGEEAIIVSGYDKGAQMGDGDRFRWINITKGARLEFKVQSSELMVNKKQEQVSAINLQSLHFNDQEIPLPERMGADVPVLEHFLPDELIKFLNSQIADQAITITEVDEEKLSFKSDSEIIISKKDLPNGWRIISKKPDFIFYDGWMLGARCMENESVFDVDLPALKTEEDRSFAKAINKKLENYEPLWEMLEFLNVLYVLNYEDSLKWRDQAEEALRAKGEGMTHDQIVEFVHYFWRSVHPAIHIKALSQDNLHTEQVVIINDDHSIGDVLTPEEVKTKYP